MVSLVVTSLVFFLVTAGAVRVAIELWPAPAEPPVTVVHWVTGHLYYGPDLPGMAKSFNATNPTTKDGKRIEIGIFDAPSSEGARELIARVTGLGSRDISLGGRGWITRTPRSSRPPAHTGWSPLTMRPDTLSWPPKRPGTSPSPTSE
jgi:hypothetical protein